ncbi:MAG: hypothetical protein V2I76_02510 [Roseobacter sp.]|nr:hypothetical protein [Roseobacter sp.]
MKGLKVAMTVIFPNMERAQPGAFRLDADGVPSYLRANGGVVSPAHFTDLVGQCTDCIRRTSLPTAQAAAKAVLLQPEAAPCAGMNDQEDTALRHAHVALYLPPD